MSRILIADPDYSSRKALTLLLARRFGIHTVDEAGNAETLFRFLANDPPAILLLDWRLYGAPAPETCRLLRKAYPSIRIVLLSLSSEDRLAALQAGADFIHKGADPGQVLAALEPIFNQSNQTQEKS